MPLEQTLTETLTRAIKERDQRTADVVRMLKTRLQERRTAKGFAGAVDDALVLDVIGAYRKQLQKALAEFEALGERGAAQAEQLTEPGGHRRQRVRRVRRPLRPSEVGRHGDAGAGGGELADRGYAGPDPAVVGDPRPVEGHVEV